MNHPFQVGDVIHEIGLQFTMPLRPMSGKSSALHTELDKSKPDAVVTELTERGFLYEYDYPVPIGRAEWGEMAVGGECFEEGFSSWIKV